MKTINKILSVIILITLLNSCNKDEIQQDASLIVPLVETIEGSSIVFIEDSVIYEVNESRGGSEYIWTVIGADFSPVEGRSDQINVTFNQTETLANISVKEKASNGKESETIMKEVKVFGTPCEWTLDMQDSYGDGWNGASVSITFDGYEAGEYTVTEEQGYSNSEILLVPNNSVIELTFNSGAWDSEVTFQLYDPSDIVLAAGPTPLEGVVYSETNVCE